MTAAQRIEAILTAITTLASEFGPLFLHSEHGQAILSTSLQTVNVLANVAETATANT